MSAFETVLAAVLPSGLALSLARRLMKSVGLGHGGIVAKSGEMKAAAALLAKAGPIPQAPVLFDVGGNIGEWTVAAKRIWPTAQVHVFEPSVRHLDKLRSAIAGLDGVTVNPVALGAEAGEAVLYKDAEISGLASMTRRDLTHVGLSMDLSEPISVATLDSYCEANGIDRIDILKIDVEGHELDVLRGSARMFGERRIGVVQFEFGGCNVDTRIFFRDFYAFFDALGYAIHIAGPGGKLTPVRRYREFHEQFSTTNYLAVRRGG